MAIVDLIYGSDKELTINKLIEVMLKDIIRPFMECIIQYNENDVKNI